MKYNVQKEVQRRVRSIFASFPSFSVLMAEMKSKHEHADSGYSSNPSPDISETRSLEDPESQLNLVIWPDGTRQTFEKIADEEILEKLVEYWKPTEEGYHSDSSESSFESLFLFDGYGKKLKEESQSDSTLSDKLEYQNWRRRIDCTGQKLRGSKSRRFVFRAWPRNPNGRRIHKVDKPQGKKPKHFPRDWVWGATLFDFYRVSACPSLPSERLFVTGSIMRDWMGELQETRWAMPEIREAEYEPAPELLKPYSLLKLLEGSDIESTATKVSQMSQITTLATLTTNRMTVLRLLQTATRKCRFYLKLFQFRVYRVNSWFTIMIV